jgi:hypothetical protein
MTKPRQLRMLARQLARAQLKRHRLECALDLQQRRAK